MNVFIYTIWQNVNNLKCIMKNYSYLNIRRCERMDTIFSEQSDLKIINIPGGKIFSGCAPVKRLNIFLQCELK